MEDRSQKMEDGSSQSAPRAALPLLSPISHLPSPTPQRLLSLAVVLLAPLWCPLAAVGVLLVCLYHGLCALCFFVRDGRLPELEEAP